MADPLWNDPGSQVRAWFDAAAEASPQERARIISAARAANPAAAEELESLLLHLGDEDAVLASTPLHMAGLLATDVLDEPAVMPANVGAFAIVREIGRGGMGVVYEAQQEFPKRRVALKLVRPELVKSSVLRRFAREIGALGVLQHEGIARLYEAGFADQSRTMPFLAMELVEGSPISTFVRAGGLPPRAVLELMALVCDAVDHAHRRGVIHRDLKPGNIFVTPAGKPKVLDFGIARLTDTAEAGATMTAPGLFVGTLGYMSPEQLSGTVGEIDHRSDVYALGVILYELLAGRAPLDMSALSVPQATVAVREREPTPLGRVNHAWRGDIEAIVGKALEKDPAQRYESAAALGADIRRYLAFEPVLARPQTTWYQAQKFTRRNRALVAGVGATMLALVAGAVATTWQAVTATRERNTATRERNAAAEQSLRATETAALLTRMVKSVTPKVARGVEPTVRQMLEAASADLATDQTVHAIVAGDTHLVLAEAFGDLGDFPKAKQHAQLSAEFRAKALGPSHPDTLDAVSYRVRVLTIEENFAEAIAIAKPNYEIAVATLPPAAYSRVRAASVYAQALAESDTPDFATAIPILREVYKQVLATKGEDDMMTQGAAQGLGIALSRAKQNNEAAAILRDVLARRERRLGPEHPDVLQSIDNLVVAGYEMVDPEAIAMEADLVKRADRILGVTHSKSLDFRHNLCLMLMAAKRYEEAMVETRIGLERALTKGGRTGSYAVDYRGLLATNLTLVKQLDEAEIQVREEIEASVDAFGADSDQAMRARTLEYDLAEARNDLPRMRRAAESIKGSRYAAECFRQLKISEKAAGIAPTATDPPDPPQADGTGR